MQNSAKPPEIDTMQPRTLNMFVRTFCRHSCDHVDVPMVSFTRVYTILEPILVGGETLGQSPFMKGGVLPWVRCINLALLMVERDVNFLIAYLNSSKPEESNYYFFNR